MSLPIYTYAHVVVIAQTDLYEVTCVLRDLKPEAFFVNNRKECGLNSPRFDTEAQAMKHFSTLIKEL